MPKDVSAKTGKTTQRNDSSSSSSSGGQAGYLGLRLPAGLTGTTTATQKQQEQQQKAQERLDIIRGTSSSGSGVTGRSSSVTPSYSSSSANKNDINLVKAITENADRSLEKTALQTTQKKYGTKMVSFDKPAYEKETITSTSKNTKTFSLPKNFSNLSVEEQQRIQGINTGKTMPFEYSDLLLYSGLGQIGLSAIKGGTGIMQNLAGTELKNINPLTNLIKTTGTAQERGFINTAGKTITGTEKAVPLIKETGILEKLVGGWGSKSIYPNFEKGIITKGADAGTKLVQENTVVKFLTGMGLSVAGTQVATPIAKGIIETIEPSQLTKEQQIKVSQEARKRIEQRVETEGLDLPIVGDDIEKYTGGIIGNLIYNLPGGTFGTTTKYYDETVNVLKEMGYSQKQAEQIAKTESKREVYGGALGELGGFVVSAGTGGELMGRASGYLTGRKLFGAGTKVVSKGSATFGATTSGAIGGTLGGLYEGFVMYPAQQKARYKPENKADWASQTLLSGATAGLAAGVIGYLSVASPAWSKRLYNFLGAAEGGQEFVGDYGAQKIVGSNLDLIFNISNKGSKTVKTRTNLFIPNLTSSLTQGNQTNGSTQSKTNQKNKTNIFQPNLAIDSIPSIEETITKEKTQTKDETPTEDDTFVKDDSFVKEDTYTKQNAWVNNILTKNETQTNTATSTSTNTFAYSFTPTPSMVPAFTGDFMPFMPPFGAESSSGKKSTKRERSRFIDEFSLAFAGLATPLQPVNFGKQKPITMAKKMYPATKITKNKKNTKKYYNPGQVLRDYYFG